MYKNEVSLYGKRKKERTLHLFFIISTIYLRFVLRKFQN